MKYKLGELIEQRKEKYSGEDLPIIGVSKEGFIPPKQKDADISIYNVFYMNDFVYNPARMELGSIEWNNKYEKAMCSSLYEMFYVKETNILMPEYLSFLIKTKWFSDYCNFLSHGSAREYCRFANISEILLNIPNIDEQKEIIKKIKVLNKRIDVLRKIDNKLEMLAYIEVKKSIEDEFEEKKLEEVIKLYDKKRKPISGDIREQMKEKKYPYYGAADLLDYVEDYIFDGIYGLIAEDGSVITSEGNPVLQYVWGKFWVNNHAHIFKGKDCYTTELIYTLLKKEKVVDIITGAVQLKINQENLLNFKLKMPVGDEIVKLNRICEKIFKYKRNIEDEIKILEKYKNVILNYIS